MSRQKRELQKNFVVFCEGDTEYNYINKMRKNQGVKIALKPINMHGGGYANFLKYIKKESQTNCLAKFILVDADRLRKHPGERVSFDELVEYCKQQNKRNIVPHFLIVDNPDFEYVACLHALEYLNQDIESFIKNIFKFKSMDDFKSNENVYDFLNTGTRSNMIMLGKIRGKEKLVKNTYSLNKKNFQVMITKTDVNWDKENIKGTNIEEFFDVIDW